MKRILVPTDFSTCASNAVQAAINIAKRVEGELHFLHFTSIPIDWVKVNIDNDELYPDVTRKIKQRQDDLNDLVRKCEKADIKASSYIGYNESYQNIIEHIAVHKIDLVVMGSNGISGFKSLFLGSNAQKVIRLSSVPVLVVKPNFQDFDPKRMVIVSDFPGALHPETEEPDQSFMKLAGLAGELSLKIDLLFVNTPAGFITGKAMRTRMKQYENMTDQKIGVAQTIDAYTLEEGVSEYLEHHDDTLIVAMMTHGETGLSRLFHRSQVEAVVNHLESPVLSVKMD